MLAELRKRTALAKRGSRRAYFTSEKHKTVTKIALLALFNQRCEYFFNPRRIF